MVIDSWRCWDDKELSCPLQKPRSHKTRTVRTEPPMPAQIMWRLPRCQMSFASTSISSIFTGSASQGNRDTRRLDAECLVVRPRSLDMRAMRQNASRYMFEAIPLLDEIIPDMVAALVNQFTVRVGDLGDMRGVDNDFASTGNRRFGFVHRLGCRPQVVVHFGWS